MTRCFPESALCPFSPFVAVVSSLGSARRGLPCSSFKPLDSTFGLTHSLKSYFSLLLFYSHLLIGRSYSTPILRRGDRFWRGYILLPCGSYWIFSPMSLRPSTNRSFNVSFTPGAADLIAYCITTLFFPSPTFFLFIRNFYFGPLPLGPVNFRCQPRGFFLVPSLNPYFEYCWKCAENRCFLSPQKLICTVVTQ